MIAAIVIISVLCLLMAAVCVFALSEMAEARESLWRAYEKWSTDNDAHAEMVRTLDERHADRMVDLAKRHSSEVMDMSAQHRAQIDALVSQLRQPAWTMPVEQGSTEEAIDDEYAKDPRSFIPFDGDLAMTWDDSKEEGR